VIIGTPTWRAMVSRVRFWLVGQPSAFKWSQYPWPPAAEARDAARNPNESACGPQPLLHFDDDIPDRVQDAVEDHLFNPAASRATARSLPSGSEVSYVAMGGSATSSVGSL
jgi:hypothetical protein